MTSYTKSFGIIVAYHMCICTYYIYIYIYIIYVFLKYTEPCRIFIISGALILGCYSLGFREQHCSSEDKRASFLRKAPNYISLAWCWLRLPQEYETSSLTPIKHVELELNSLRPAGPVRYAPQHNPLTQVHCMEVRSPQESEYPTLASLNRTGC